MKMSSLKGAIYVGDSKISSAERDRLMREEGIAMSAEEFGRLAEQAVERHAEFFAWIKPRMTPARAVRVRQLRCTDNASYRDLACNTWVEWYLLIREVPIWHPPTNQLAGVALCQAAAELLGEDHHVYPWEANQA